MEEGTGLIVLSIPPNRNIKKNKSNKITLLSISELSTSNIRLERRNDAKTRGIVERIYNLPMRSVLSHKDDSLTRKTPPPPPPSHSRGFILEFQVNETTFFDRITT